ncbi:aminodeoxychorismate synthase component I [Pseudazoarcus pumilus]|uniref:Aminodeoxychorismate synthase, component I n=1 Tax=Pseudazoarcus pumilus TaxID=2067960 RepID=A0A2I6S6F8_9RHOO|nr:aminodeoxychorismate synthase component I [Pseudazoarcus pumilus]AUN94829.1 aminodeoxychorismate synthase, component I [Pseudazoarcus pumilus]
MSALDITSTFALFDDNLSGGGDLLLEGLCETIVCHRTDEIDAVFAHIEAARRRGKWVAIAASFELGQALEPRLARTARAANAPLMTVWVFSQATKMPPDRTAIAIDAALAGLDEHQRVAAVGDVRRALDANTYRDGVARIRAFIEAGDCYQVNYTFALRGRILGESLALYAALRERQPVRFGTYLHHADGCILSRSPELFVERSGLRLTCRPMKGTAPREAGPEALTASEKDRAENVMIVDLIRNDLGRLAPPGGVRVDSLLDVEAYPTLWQMTSTISAEPIDADLATIFRALFPCGSVTGAPKIRAMEIIRELEPAPRGLYCGALGWLAPDGDFRFSVPIRTLEADARGHFRCGLGSGIVADSEPTREWDECLLKGRFLTGLRPTFGLIETLRCEPQSDAPYPLLERHLARLTASAGFFGFDCDSATVRAILYAHAGSLQGPHRVRLELSPDGRLMLDGGPLQALPEPVRVGFAASRLRSDDVLARHKTTARARYDAALREASAAGLFDVLFFNERDQLVEGARTSVFIEDEDGALLTPPLAAGALDGVLRRELIESGRAREAVIDRTHLAAARRVFVGNALRGLLRATLSD